MRAFRQPIYIADAAANELVPVSVPSSQLFIQSIVLSGTGAFNLTVYNRDFYNYRRRVRGSTSGSGITTIDFYFPHPYTLDDHLSLYESGGSEIQAHMRVQSVPSDTKVILSGEETISADDYVLKVIPIARFDVDLHSFDSAKMALVMGATRRGVPHIRVQPGDTITIADTDTAYDGVHTVLRSQDDVIVTATAYNAAVDRAASGRFNLSIETAAAPAHEVIPLTAAASNVVRYESTGRAVSMVHANKTAGPGTLYFKPSVAGDYYGYIAGYQPN